MEAHGATDEDPRNTSGTSEVSERRQQEQESRQEEAAWRVNAPNHVEQRHLRRLMRLAVWVTVFYMLPRIPRADAQDHTDLRWLVDDVRRIPQLTPLTQVFGRWYVVQDLSPRSTFQIPTNQWFDIYLDENGLLVAQWFQKTEEGYVLNPPVPIRAELPETPEFDDEKWDEKERGPMYEMVSLLPDEGYMSLAVCADRPSNCTVLLLTRVAAEDGSDDFATFKAENERESSAHRILFYVDFEKLMPCTYNATDSRMHCSF